MHLNPHIVEALARQREAETQRLVKYAWMGTPRPRLGLGQRLGGLFVIGVMLSCGLMWLLP